MDLKQIFSRLNGRTEPGPTEILVLPHSSGATAPHMDEHSRGAVLGLPLGTRRMDLYKAMMEEINYELALVMSALLNAGIEVGQIISTGGSPSPRLLQIKTDILGRGIHTARNQQTGSLGGTMLGAIAFGEHDNLETAVVGMVRSGTTYKPDRTARELYAEYMNQYRRVYSAARSVFE